MPEPECEPEPTCTPTCEWRGFMTRAARFYTGHPSTRVDMLEDLAENVNKQRPDDTRCAGRLVLNSVSVQLQIECMNEPTAPSISLHPTPELPSL